MDMQWRFGGCSIDTFANLFVDVYLYTIFSMWCSLFLVCVWSLKTTPSIIQKNQNSFVGETLDNWQTSPGTDNCLPLRHLSLDIIYGTPVEEYVTDEVRAPGDRGIWSDRRDDDIVLAIAIVSC